MSYFADLHTQLTDLLWWADLRHEQGINAAKELEPVRRALAAARRRLEKTAAPAALLRREPESLRAIQALRPKGSRRLCTRWRTAELRDRMEGAWLGRAAGCTLGAPVELWPVAEMEALAKRLGMAFPPEDYWTGHPRPEELRYGASPQRDYLRDYLRFVPVDDDLTYTALGLLILEESGTSFTTEDVARAWLRYLPMACTAEHVALENLKAGIPAARAAVRNNPYVEWIGADIRSDPWGYACAGWPERAAEMAWRDARLSHRGGGVYGAMFFSAAIAASFVVDDPLEALRIGLTEIPAECRLATEVRWALTRATRLKDWRAARRAVDERFAGMSGVHTYNNACLTVFGIALGQGDFTRTIGTTVALGLDNDCTGATVGSMMGAAQGKRGLPGHWWKPFRNRTRTYLRGHEWFTNTDIAKRFVSVCLAVHEADGRAAKRGRQE